MLFKNFIIRFVALEEGFISILKIEENMISFRVNDEAMRCLKDLEDLLNTLLEGKDGKFVLSLNMINKSLDFKFEEGGC